MVLIFGGAYQGKLGYALENFGLSEKDVYHCEERAGIDLSFKVINNLEKFVMACVKEGIEAKELLDEYGDTMADKIIIVTDISQGIVPMNPDERSWREMTGRTMLYLSRRADRVIRVFCGLGQEIKSQGEC